MKIKTAWKGMKAKKNLEVTLTAKRDLALPFITTGNSTLRYMQSFFPKGSPNLESKDLLNKVIPI